MQQPIPQATPVAMAVWQQYGAAVLRPTSGASWQAYTLSGGPSRYMDARRKK